jgi:hypothetical protein
LIISYKTGIIIGIIVGFIVGIIVGFKKQEALKKYENSYKAYWRIYNCCLNRSSPGGNRSL